MTTSVKHIRGDTWKRTWAMKDGAGVAIDLTGANARLHARDVADQIVVEASSSGVSPRLTISGLAGTIAMVVPASAMNIVPGRYPFDIEITYADGTVQTIEQGSLVIGPDRTHD